MMAVDVGVNALGWAWIDPYDSRLVAAGVIKPRSRRDHWKEKVREVARAFFIEPWSDYLSSQRVTPQRWRLAIEWPEFRGGDPVGFAAASNDSYAMLVYMTGVLAGQAYQNCVPVTLVPVSEWKGQLSKENTRRRLEWFFKTIGHDKSIALLGESHAWDAAGVGYHVIGFNTQTKTIGRPGRPIPGVKQ